MQPGTVSTFAELVGQAIAAVIITLGTLQAWLSIQKRRNGGQSPIPHNPGTSGGFRVAEVEAALLKHERELIRIISENGTKIGTEGDATRREMRDGFDRLERAIRGGV